MAYQISKEEIKEAFKKAVVKNKYRISMGKLTERVSKNLGITESELKSIPNIYMYCKFNMGEMFWVYNIKKDRFEKVV